MEAEFGHWPVPAETARLRQRATEVWPAAMRRAMARHPFFAADRAQDAGQQPLRVTAPRLSPAAGFFWLEDTSGRVAALRDCVRSALEDDGMRSDWDG